MYKTFVFVLNISINIEYITKKSIFPNLLLKICISYVNLWNFSKKIGRGHIKTKMNQLVVVPQESNNVTFF